eukprot:m51a1_g13051 hypothetical protein (365) ;mRNA; f:1105-2822
MSARKSVAEWAAAAAPYAVEAVAAVAVAAAAYRLARGGPQRRAGPAVGVDVGRATCGGEVVALGLREHGVRALYTLPGMHVAPINVAAKALGINVIDVRTEATAVFAAEGHYRLTGFPGVATVTAGPGLATTAPAVANARASRSAVVLLGGSAASYLAGRGAAQSDPDAAQALGRLCKAHLRPTRLAELAGAVARAFHEAASGVPGPVLVEFPMEVVYSLADFEATAASTLFPAGADKAPMMLRWQLQRHASRVFGAVGSRLTIDAPIPVDIPLPRDCDVEAAARILVDARRPVIVLGSGAAAIPYPNRAAEHAADLKSALTTMGVPVHLTGCARGALGRGCPLEFRQSRREVLERADAVPLAR